MVKIMGLGLIVMVCGQLSMAGQMQGSGRQPVELKFASSVPESQSLRLSRDLQLLNQLIFVDQDGELRRLYQLESVNSENLANWLRERAKVVIDQNYPLDESTVHFGVGPVQYPTVNTRAVRWEFADSGAEGDNQDALPPEASIVMSNIGGALYRYGKDSRTLVSFDVLGVGAQVIRSPRAGIFQIGMGLFLPISRKMPQEMIENKLHSIFRLGTLFHEARHSDGNGLSLSFAHALCPIGHDYVGLPACDTPANGPYRLESLFTAAARAGCGDCSVAEQEILALLKLDSDSRILSPTKAGASQPPSARPQTDLCSFMGKLNVAAEFCQAPSRGEVVEWDPKPESVQ